MLAVVVDVLLVGSDVRFRSRCELLVPVALALLLLLDLLLLDAVDLFGAPVGVLLESELLSLGEGANL